MRRRVGMFFVFVWGLSLAEHIDFSRKDMCNTLTQCTGKAWLGRAGRLIGVRWQKDVGIVEWPKGPVNCKSSLDLIGCLNG